MIAFNQNHADDEEDDRPEEHVLRWCRALVETIADGGNWGIPRSQIVFKLDKKARKLVLVFGDADNPDFIATKRVFKHIGWDVVAEE